MEQAEEHCYVCLQGSTEETPFMDPNPCYCRGSTKLHQHCFNQMRETVYKCGMCNKDWRDGKYTRIWDNQYCDNGNKWQETHYSDGKLHGTHTSWDFEGVKVLESNYDNGQNHGPFTWFHRNGTKMSETNFVHNQYHGPRLEWYENGQKKREYNYDNGQIHGLYQEWNEDGTIKLERYYDHGIRRR